MTDLIGFILIIPLQTCCPLVTRSSGKIVEGIKGNLHQTNVKCGHVTMDLFPIQKNICSSDSNYGPTFEVTRCFRYITGTSDKG